jgi:hypothetical protein
MPNIKLKSLINEGKFLDFLKSKSTKQKEAAQKVFGWAYSESNAWRHVTPKIQKEFIAKLSDILGKENVDKFIESELDKSAVQGNWNRVSFIEDIQQILKK